MQINMPFDTKKSASGVLEEQFQKVFDIQAV